MKLNKLNDTAEHMEKLTFLFCLVLLMVFIVIGVNMFASLKQNNTEIETMRSEIIALQSNGSGNKTQEQIHLDFLENEMVRHQDFIETQRQHLMWLVSLIGTIGILLIGFFGFRTRAEIQNTIAKQELDISESGINHYIGGNENRQYLETAIQRERKAQNAKILFIETEYRKLMLDGTKIYFEKEPASHLEAFNLLEFLPTKEKKPHQWKLRYDECMEIISENNLQIQKDITKRYEKEIEKNLDGHDLVIYEIPNRGTEKKGNDHYNNALKSVKAEDYKFCKLICNHCNKEGIYCIVYTNTGNILPLESSFYTTFSKYKLNLIQTATTILNLMI